MGGCPIRGVPAPWQHVKESCTTSADSLRGDHPPSVIKEKTGILRADARRQGKSRLSRGQSPESRGKSQGKSQGSWFPWRQRRQIQFNRVVKVTEFTRALDGGGTVPSDGTFVTLGLGKFVRTSWAPLASAPARAIARKTIEEKVWVPSRDRVILLRQAMGDARYFGRWVKCRCETRRVVREREESNASPKDFSLMPESYEEARSRGLRLAEEMHLDRRLGRAVVATRHSEAARGIAVVKPQRSEVRGRRCAKKSSEEQRRAFHPASAAEKKRKLSDCPETVAIRPRKTRRREFRGLPTSELGGTRRRRVMCSRALVAHGSVSIPSNVASNVSANIHVCDGGLVKCQNESGSAVGTCVGGSITRCHSCCHPIAEGPADERCCCLTDCELQEVERGHLRCCSRSE
eukprot:TRINITY_DN61635_c0_g1_i1.p1 TRINITY_DN61635_c0_g1~~TRINITY_DN61635_c0_g1_i1.p1  ORF type:complete len:404 (-),score=35.87 TRINITY_DN61635_c0_g1_i1:152-1363(-)